MMDKLQQIPGRIDPEGTFPDVGFGAGSDPGGAGRDGIRPGRSGSRCWEPRCGRVATAGPTSTSRSDAGHPRCGRDDRRYPRTVEQFSGVSSTDGDPAYLSQYAAMDSHRWAAQTTAEQTPTATPKPAKSTRPTETSPTITSAEVGRLALGVRGNRLGFDGHPRGAKLRRRKPRGGTVGRYGGDGMRHTDIGSM